jgi:hypothetical protein
MAAPINAFVSVSVNLVNAVSADRFGFGSLRGVFTHTVTTDRVNGPYFSITEVNDAGFTSAITPAINLWASKVFTQDNGVDSVTIGRIDALDADYTETLDAIELWENLNNGAPFYLLTIESRAKADILDVDAWASARAIVFIAQSSDADFLAGTPGNVGETLNLLGTVRTALAYHADDAEPLDGAWASVGGGFDLDTPDGVGIWAYSQLTGITFDNLTGAQANAIWDVGGNIYGRNLGLSFTSKGTMAAGAPRFIDVTTTIDWVQRRSEEAVLAFFVGTKKVPYTDSGITRAVGVLQGVMDNGVTFGHFSPDTPIIITAPQASTVSAADKAARKLTLSASAQLAGAAQLIVFTIDLTF